MNNTFSLRWVGLSASLILASALTGCHQKTDANTELDKAARTIQKTEAAPAPAPAPQPQAAAPPSSPAQKINQAVTAYKAGQMVDAVTQLQQLRATPTLTPQQRIALNDAMAAVMSQISTLAAKGDSRAVQALDQYNKMQNQRQ